jgi:hypothetical protein
MSNDKPRTAREEDVPGSAREAVHVAFRTTVSRGGVAPFCYPRYPRVDCGTLCDALTAAIERHRAERAGTGATRLRDDVEARVIVATWMTAVVGEHLSGKFTWGREGRISHLLDMLDAHLQKAMPAAPAPAVPGQEPRCGGCGKPLKIFTPDESRARNRYWCPNMSCEENGAPVPIAEANVQRGASEPAPAPLRDWAARAIELLRKSDRGPTATNVETCECRNCELYRFLREYDAAHAPGRDAK